MLDCDLTHQVKIQKSLCLLNLNDVFARTSKIHGISNGIIKANKVIINKILQTVHGLKDYQEINKGYFGIKYYKERVTLLFRLLNGANL